MSLLDRVHDCSRHDVASRVPLHVDGEVWGHLEPRLAEALVGFPAVFVAGSRSFALHPDLVDAETRTRAVGSVVDALYARGFFASRRGELYPVTRRFEDPPVFALERGAVGAFGTSAFGVHLNGVVRGANGPRLWVARRAESKPTYPGRLDHLVGGGQPMGLSLRANMRKECAEEAGIPLVQSAGIAYVHGLRYRLTDEHGLHDDTMHVFDLELPEGFTPTPQDGEVESFALWPIARVVDTLRASRAFKPNVALVILDWMLREGLLRDDPEHDALEAAIEPMRVALR